jgi:hypothetical protein
MDCARAGERHAIEANHTVIETSEANASKFAQRDLLNAMGILGQ